MSIRVSTNTDAQGTILRVDGRLTSEDVAELSRTFADAAQPVVLDLSDLQWADRAGVDLLRQFLTQGAETRGITPYFELVLKTRD